MIGLIVSLSIVIFFGGNNLICGFLSETDEVTFVHTHNTPQIIQTIGEISLLYTTTKNELCAEGSNQDITNIMMQTISRTQKNALIQLHAQTIVKKHAELIPNQENIHHFGLTITDLISSDEFHDMVDAVLRYYYTRHTNRYITPLSEEK